MLNYLRPFPACGGISSCRMFYVLDSLVEASLAAKDRSSCFFLTRLCRMQLKKICHAGAVLCDRTRAATCALAWVVGTVQDQKANATLTELNLNSNNVGDAGASALAEAVKATVFTCKNCVFRACVCCHRKCRFTKSSEELASSTCCAGCVAAFVILLVVRRKTFTHF